MPDYTPYQQKVIKRYYDHRDQIMLTKLQELATELYLAETDKQRDRLWERVATALQNLKVPAALAQHILAARKPEVLAANVKQWLDSASKKK